LQVTVVIHNLVAAIGVVVVVETAAEKIKGVVEGSRMFENGPRRKRKCARRIHLAVEVVEVVVVEEEGEMSGEDEK
jgi:hypothetical protein